MKVGHANALLKYEKSHLEQSVPGVLGITTTRSTLAERSSEQTTDCGSTRVASHGNG